jgi:hypothetical protein
LPPLTDPRYEVFAQARARGVNRLAAYVQSGFKPHRSGASKLAKRPGIALRIAYLERLNERIKEAGPAPTILALMALADSGDALKSAGGVKEARLARLEASRLWERLVRDQAQVNHPVDRQLTLEEWMAKHGPAAQRGA